MECLRNDGRLHARMISRLQRASTSLRRSDGDKVDEVIYKTISNNN